MRTAFAVFLLLHGLAHLVGFVTPWGSGTPKADGTPQAGPPPNPRLILGGRYSLSRRLSRTLGFLWLAAAGAFAVAAYGIWSAAAWQWGALLVALLASLVLTFVWLPVARIGLAINILLLGAFLAATAL
jgi:hypothetical protein